MGIPGEPLDEAVVKCHESLCPHCVIGPPWIICCLCGFRTICFCLSLGPPNREPEVYSLPRPLSAESGVQQALKIEGRSISTPLKQGWEQCHPHRAVLRFKVSVTWHGAGQAGALPPCVSPASVSPSVHGALQKPDGSPVCWPSRLQLQLRRATQAILSGLSEGQSPTCSQRHLQPPGSPEFRPGSSPLELEEVAQILGSLRKGCFSLSHCQQAWPHGPIQPLAGSSGDSCYF